MSYFDPPMWSESDPDRAKMIFEEVDEAVAGLPLGLVVPPTPGSLDNLDAGWCELHGTARKHRLAPDDLVYVYGLDEITNQPSTVRRVRQAHRNCTRDRVRPDLVFDPDQLLLG